MRSTAQRILESYASSHPDLTRTYLLSGVPLANPAMSAKEEGEEDDKMDVDHPSTGDSEVYKPPAETLEGRQAARSVVVLCKSDQIEGSVFSPSSIPLLLLPSIRNLSDILCLALLGLAPVPARKKQFDPSSLSTHIYSLSPPSSLPTPSSLVQPFFALLSHKAYLSPNLYGSKSNGSIVVLKGGEARLKAGQVDKPKSSVEVSKVAGKGKKDDVAPTAQGKKIGTLDWSKATLKKPVPPPPPLPAPASAEKKRSTSTSSSKPRAILSESEEEDSSDLTSAREKAKGPPMVARPSAPVVQKPVKEKKDVVQATSKEEKERLEQQKKELEGLWDMDVDEDEFSGNIPPPLPPPPLCTASRVLTLSPNARVALLYTNRQIKRQAQGSRVRRRRRDQRTSPEASQQDRCSQTRSQGQAQAQERRIIVDDGGQGGERKGGGAQCRGQSEEDEEGRKE